MLRALLKATMAWPVGWLPGGVRAYHGLTCGVLGSQAFHPPKLANAWRRYASLLPDALGVQLEGLAVWVHDAGWTPISALATYLVTGRAAILTNTRARVLDRYLAPSVEAALSMDLDAAPIPSATVDRRKAELAERARGISGRALVEALGGAIHDGVSPHALPLATASMDCWHTGNALEHYAPARLDSLLGEGHRILRPDAIASHVVDHRDHLHHVDRDWPFLAHRTMPERVYRILLGHPLLYHNRLGPQALRHRFADGGYAELLVRRAGASLCYVTDREVLAQASGAPRWSRRAGEGLNPLDVRTTYAHYLLRRRSSP